MPEMRRFVVTQLREVEVEANRIDDAVRIAAKAFDGGPEAVYPTGGLRSKDGLDGVWGDTMGRIEIIDMTAHDLKPRKGKT